MSRPAIVVALLLLLLAGCLDHARAPAMTVVVLPAFTDQPLPSNVGGSEPNIAVTPDGKTAYVVAPDAKNHSHVWRGDRGQDNWTWTDVGTVAEEYGDNDNDIAVRPDGSVWVATMWVYAGSVPVNAAAKCTAVSVSHDRGATWATTGLGCGTSPFFDERPWLATSGQDTYLLRYQSVAQQERVPPALSQSTDGKTWQDHLLTEVPPGFVSRLVASDGTLAFASFAAQKASTTCLALCDVDGYVGPTVWTSNDGGGTWASQDLARERNDMRFPGLALSGGRGVATWMPLGPNGKGASVRASFLADGTWGKPTTLAETGTNVMAWTDGNNGHLVVAWLHTSEVAHPCDVSQDSEWTLEVWQDGTRRSLPFVAQRGPLFDAIGSGSCGNDARQLGDYISAAALPDGGMLVASPVSTSGCGFNECPLHVVWVPPPT